jgi:hypothetical protein
LNSPYLNDNVVTKQMTAIARFVSQIPFSALTGVTPLAAKVSAGDAFAMKSDQLIFGWAVNPESDVSGAQIALASLPDGRYSLQMYHTWGGRFFHEENISCVNGSIEFSIPILKIEDSHARYVGQDIAFILKPVK